MGRDAHPAPGDRGRGGGCRGTRGERGRRLAGPRPRVVIVTAAVGAVWFSDPDFREGAGASYLGSRRRLGEPMASVTADLKARERAGELRQTLGRKYRYIDRKWDIMFWATAAFVVGAAADITKQLFAGDWDFWTDWKDAQWWPIITPFAIIIIPSALQYIQWLAWKFPTGGVYTAVCLWACVEIGRWLQWRFFVYYPINFVWPATAVLAGIWLDWVLLKSKSWV